MQVQSASKSSVSPLTRLHDCGQAVWLDFLARRFIGGDLSKLVEQDGLTGGLDDPQRGRSPSSRMSNRLEAHQ